MIKKKKKIGTEYLKKREQVEVEEKERNLGERKGNTDGQRESSQRKEIK